MVKSFEEFLNEDIHSSVYVSLESIFSKNVEDRILNKYILDESDESKKELISFLKERYYLTFGEQYNGVFYLYGKGSKRQLLTEYDLENKDFNLLTEIKPQQ